MGPSSRLSYDTGGLSHCCNPHRFLHLEGLMLYFLVLEPWVLWSVLPPVDPPILSACKCGISQSTSHQPPCYHASSPPWLPIPTPPTGLDECFFFNSLVARLQYSSIFWQFWLFYVFKLVVILLLVVWGSEAYLPTSPSWLKANTLFYGFLKQIILTRNYLHAGRPTHPLREKSHQQ